MPTHNLRIYYEDTDAAGVVYYANYLKFAERARTEAVRTAGIHQASMLEAEGVGFVVKSVQAEFIKPAKLDDLLTITTLLHDMRGASLTLSQTIWRGDEKLVELVVKLAVVDRNFKPLRLAEPLKTTLVHAFKEPPCPPPPLTP